MTQGKLREAAFFLRRLTQATHGFVGEEVEAFPHYLSAFLSAGRSVTFALQAEEKEKYDTWFPAWLRRQPEETRELLDFMKGQRNQVLKRGQAEVKHEIQFVPLVKAYPIENRQALAFQWFGPPGIPPPAIGRRVRHFDLNGTDTEVLKACEDYLKILEALIADFFKVHEPAA